MDFLTSIEADCTDEEDTERVYGIVKLYVLGNKKVVGQRGSVLVDDISHLDEVFVVEWVKE